MRLKTSLGELPLRNEIGSTIEKIKHKNTEWYFTINGHEYKFNDMLPDGNNVKHSDIINNKNAFGVNIKLSDYNLGFDKVLQQYADSLKETYDYSEDWTFCREYIHQDSIFLDGEDKDTKTIRDRILSRYAKRIFTVINSKNMNYRTVRKIFILGGCAGVMQPYLQDVFKKANLEVDTDPQFSNARLFEEVAHAVFS